MSSRDERGFTVLETVFALAIVALAAVAVLSALGAQLRAAERAQRAMEAAALAEHRLERIRLLPIGSLRPLPDSLARGHFEPPFAAYGWEAMTRSVRGEEELVDVVVRVRWDAGVYVLNTRLFRPRSHLTLP